MINFLLARKKELLVLKKKDPHIEYTIRLREIDILIKRLTKIERAVTQGLKEVAKDLTLNEHHTIT